MPLRPEQLAERALSNITGDNLRMFYVLKVSDAPGRKTTVDVIREE
jgi:hypothetical protein